jgi:hypothetical protein
MLTSFLHDHPCADFSRYPMLLGVWVTMIWLAGAHERRPSAIFRYSRSTPRSIKRTRNTGRDSLTPVPISTTNILHSFNIREGPD